MKPDPWCRAPVILCSKGNEFFSTGTGDVEQPILVQIAGRHQRTLGSAFRLR